jgi:hypothetical protein
MADDSTLWRPRIFGAIVLVLSLVWPVAAGAQDTDLDALMARVLERRKETWRVLHDYVLDERERFALVGPADLRLYGSDRAYTWYVRDGVLVRSPVKANGVTVPEAERRAYEDKWLAEEQAKAAKPEGASGDTSEAAPAVADPGQASAAGVTKSLEPRFVSEAYFLRFRFERGRYFLAGRETIDGRPVLKVEYYPTNLFRDASEQKRREEERAKAAPAPPDDAKKRKTKGKGDKDREIAIKLEADIDRKFNKVALVTIWIDPVDAQIVRYDFENLGLDFLPAQWFVRVGETTASMTMGRYFDGVWLPKSISMRGDVQLALGSFDVEYEREFLEYRKAETAARIRAYGDVH